MTASFVCCGSKHLEGIRLSISRGSRIPYFSIYKTPLGIGRGCRRGHLEVEAHSVQGPAMVAVAAVEEEEEALKVVVVLDIAGALVPLSGAGAVGPVSLGRAWAWA